MGHYCSEKNVMTVLSAIEQVLVKQGANINKGVAIEAATEIMFPSE